MKRIKRTARRILTHWRTIYALAFVLVIAGARDGIGATDYWQGVLLALGMILALIAGSLMAIRQYEPHIDELHAQIERLHERLEQAG